MTIFTAIALRKSNWCALLAFAALSSLAVAQPLQRPAWQDDYTTRLEALALLQTLNAELLSNDSATLTLDRWCATHKLATPARIVAERVGRQPTPAPELVQEPAAVRAPGKVDLAVAVEAQAGGALVASGKQQALDQHLGVGDRRRRPLGAIADHQSHRGKPG